MKARKLPSGKWNVQAYIGEIDGKKRFKSFTADSKKEAEYLAHAYLQEKEELSIDTIKNAIESYISNRSSVLSPSTLRSYRTMQRNDFTDIENLRISSITSEDIQKFINELSKRKSPKSVRNVYGLLKASILAIKPNKAINVRLPQKEVIERHIPTAEDIRRILDISDHELSIAIMLASVGTLRIGEICALEYEDIKGNTIHVHRDMIPNENDEYVIKNIPKTDSSDRYVTFPDNVIKEIGKGKGRIMQSTPRAISARYAKKCKRLGIKSTRFHDLRHYAASAMHAANIPDSYIMERGGWKNDTVLKSVYRNTLADKRKEFEDMANEELSKSLFG